MKLDARAKKFFRSAQKGTHRRKGSSNNMSYSTNKIEHNEQQQKRRREKKYEEEIKIDEKRKTTETNGDTYTFRRRNRRNFFPSFPLFFPLCYNANAADFVFHSRNKMMEKRASKKDQTRKEFVAREGDRWGKKSSIYTCSSIASTTNESQTTILKSEHIKMRNSADTLYTETHRRKSMRATTTKIASRKDDVWQKTHSGCLCVHDDATKYNRSKIQYAESFASSKTTGESTQTSFIIYLGVLVNGEGWEARHTICNNGKRDRTAQNRDKRTEIFVV